MDPVENAVQMFKEGHSCSQSILASFGPRFNLERETALKLAGPFGGGIGRLGLQCGAVSGAVMVLGLHGGRIDPNDDATRDRNDELVREFMSRFAQIHRTTICNELTGVDITDVKVRQKASEEGIFARVCPDLVRLAAQLVQELIGKATAS